MSLTYTKQSSAEAIYLRIPLVVGMTDSVVETRFCYFLYFSFEYDRLSDRNSSSLQTARYVYLRHPHRAVTYKNLTKHVSSEFNGSVNSQLCNLREPFERFPCFPRDRLLTTGQK